MSLLMLIFVTPILTASQAGLSDNLHILNKLDFSPRFGFAYRPKSKFFKETEVWVKTKTPVLVLKTDNQIPRE